MIWVAPVFRKIAERFLTDMCMAFLVSDGFKRQIADTSFDPTATTNT